MDSDNITLGEQITITLPGQPQSTVILPPGTGTGGEAIAINWLWPIISGIVIVIAAIFVVRSGWNIRGNK